MPWRSSPCPERGCRDRRDPQALTRAAGRLKSLPQGPLTQGNFHELETRWAAWLRSGSLAGVLADLGVSSLQRNAERGFSFRRTDARHAHGTGRTDRRGRRDGSSEGELEQIFRSTARRGRHGGSPAPSRASGRWRRSRPPAGSRSDRPTPRRAGSAHHRHTAMSGSIPRPASSRRCASGQPGGRRARGVIDQRCASSTLASVVIISYTAGGPHRQEHPARPGARQVTR